VAILQWHEFLWLFVAVVFPSHCRAIYVALTFFASLLTEIDPS